MTESGTFCKDDWKVKNTGIQQTPAGMSRSPSALPWLCDAARARLANALARLTPACGPRHHAPGRSRAARYCNALLSRAARERRSHGSGLLSPLLSTKPCDPPCYSTLRTPLLPRCSPVFPRWLPATPRSHRARASAWACRILSLTHISCARTLSRTRSTDAHRQGLSD